VLEDMPHPGLNIFHLRIIMICPRDDLLNEGSMSV
jgi:hypothetical protein